MLFNDIPRLPILTYHIDVPLSLIKRNIDIYIKDHDLDFNPEFQRGYVWSEFQKTAYMEWILRGGRSGLNIYFNHPGWMRDFKGRMVLVDGKQRLSAIDDFFNNKLKVFGCYFNEYADNIPLDYSLSFYVAKLKTELEVVDWYIAMNTGGSVHTDSDINKAKEYRQRLINTEKK
jgi:hypothetical protein